MIHEQATQALADLLLALREERGPDAHRHAEVLQGCASWGWFPDVDAAQDAANREHEDRCIAGF